MRKNCLLIEYGIYHLRRKIHEACLRRGGYHSQPHEERTLMEELASWKKRMCGIAERNRADAQR